VARQERHLLQGEGGQRQLNRLEGRIYLTYNFWKSS
jgi:hypothetical protein